MCKWFLVWVFLNRCAVGYGTQCGFDVVIGLPRFHYRERGKTVARVVSEVKSAFEMVKKQVQKRGPMSGPW